LKGTHVLNFDQDRFLRIQAGALAQAEGIHRTIGGYLEAGAANLFFLGSGGAGILMMPAVQLLQDRSTLPVHLRLPAELVELGSVHLGPQSIVVIPSLSGTTKESVKALSYCQDRGGEGRDSHRSRRHPARRPRG
jgi:fructoselysine-6-phosphate deglycase